MLGSDDERFSRVLAIAATQFGHGCDLVAQALTERADRIAQDRPTRDEIAEAVEAAVAPLNERITELEATAANRFLDGQQALVADLCDFAKVTTLEEVYGLIRLAITQ